MTYTATYSPEDNKIRLYASSRLDKELYLRVREAGYIWAPKQDCFVAPMWTPAREDLALELAGEIEDEDKSLVERAEDRADRFEGYRENRTADAEAAHRAVSRIADGIPLGQPILIGHHSERHARRDAEKIENGMRRAVKMWDTAEYWKSRAAGAIAHAKYKELPAVRARRIKGLEADLRKQLKNKAETEKFLGLWERMEPEDWDRARAISNYDRMGAGQCFPLDRYPRLRPDASTYEGAMGIWSALDGIITPAQARELAMKGHARYLPHCQRWIDHYTNRLEYETAMLAEGGGLVADKFNFGIGGRVKRRGEWFVVTGLNRREGQLLSVSVAGHWAGTIPVEDITDYREPAEGDAEKVKKAKKLFPLVNFRAPNCVEMTAAEWKQRSGWSDSYYVATFTADHKQVWGREKEGAPVYRLRSCSGKNWERVPVFLVDSKVIEPPTIVAAQEPIRFERERDTSVQFTRATDEEIAAAVDPSAPKAADFQAMRESLRAGVKTVSVPQLFPTPPALAARMVEELGQLRGERILEPSAGTGNLVKAVLEVHEADDMQQVIVAVELNLGLADMLRSQFTENAVAIQCCDFLQQNGNFGLFDKIVMNPPFINGADIQHIEHARHMLKPGGRLVALCANGPRQNERLKPLAENSGGIWEELPENTFRGTGVRVVLLTIEA